MKLGEVFYWVTDQAVGHDARAKFHIFVCPEDWVDSHTFLFVNKGMWGEDFKLNKADYPFLEYDSYVACSGLASYSDAELKSFDQNPVGAITADHLKEIMFLIDGSKTMERQQKKRICAALSGAS